MEYVNKKLNEFNEYIKFRKVAIIGLGVSNLPLLDYMYDKKAHVTVFDERESDSIGKDILDKIVCGLKSCQICATIYISIHNRREKQ